MAPAKLLALVALFAGASAFAPATSFSRGTALYNGPVKGAGGMADTRDPEPQDDDDPRKSISAAPSFAEYQAQKAEAERRAAEGN